jgi:hypothetical protein
VGAVGEAALDVDRGVVRVRIAPLLDDLLAQVLPLLLELGPELGELRLLDHGIPLLHRLARFPLRATASLLEPPPGYRFAATSPWHVPADAT